MLAGIDSDHCPIIADIRISLRADYKKEEQKPNTRNALKSNRTNLTNHYKQTNQNTSTTNRSRNGLKNAAEEHMTKKTPTSNPLNVQKIQKTFSTQNAQ